MTEPSPLRRMSLRSGSRARGDAELDWLEEDLRATTPRTYAMASVLPIAIAQAVTGIGILVWATFRSDTLGNAPVIVATSALWIVLGLVLGTWLGNRTKAQVARRVAVRRRERAGAAPQP